ncbi:hypothetical protein N9M74_00900 [Pontimonas sp.]|nr:hypothetical protein [Pontimonas sp.]
MIPEGVRRRIAVYAGLLVVALGTSSLLAHWVSGSYLAEPALEIVAYYAEDSTAEVYISDEFGNFVEDRSRSYPIVSGINRIDVDLSDSFGGNTFAYRFDPCTCVTPVVIGSVSLVSPFVTRNIPPEAWQAGADSALAKEGTYFRLQDLSATADPQLIIYPDLSIQQRKFSSQTFWIVFIFGAGLALASVAVVRAVRSRRPTRRLGIGGHSASTTSEGPGPPLWLLVTSAALTLAGVVQQFMGAVSSGVTIDEPLHVQHLSSFFGSGVYSSSAYGPATALFAHTLNVAAGSEQLWTVSMSADAYVVRHLAVAILGVMTAVSVALIARVALGHWGWALVSVGLLLSFPLWVGHSMFNIKDVPLAAGFTMFTAGLALLTSQLTRRWIRLSAGVLLLLTGLFFGVGTRPIGMVLMGASAVLLGVVWGAPRLSRIVHSSRIFGVFGVVLIGGLLLALVGVAQFEATRGFLSTSLEYPWNGWNLYGGQRVGARPGFWNVLGVYAATTPILVGALVLAGTVSVGARFFTRSPKLYEQFSERATFALVAFQGAGAFLAVLLLDPVLYDGARQILFVIPALSIIATAGLHLILARLRNVSIRRSAMGVAMAGAIALGLGAPMGSQIQLFPYNYSFYNVIAQGAGVNGSWETDYWGSSIREAAGVVAGGDPVTCRSVGDLNFTISSLEPCATLSPYVGAGAALANSTLPDNHFWVLRTERTLAWHGPVTSDNCTFHSQVTRPLRGEDVSMAWVYQCEDR